MARTKASSTSSTAAGSIDSAQLLAQLTGETEQKIAQIEARPTVDLDQRFAEIESEMDEAAKIRDERMRDLRMKVLGGNLQELRKDAAQEAEDLAQAVLGLNTMLEGMGQEYASLNQPSAEEQALIKAAEQAIQTANADLEKARGKTFFRGRAIATANADIERAKTALEHTKEDVKRLSRQRLLKADIEASLQEFMMRVERTIGIMERRHSEIQRQLAAVTTRKEKAFLVKQAAAKELEALDADLTKKEEELAREEEALTSAENGSPEHAIQTQKVSDLRAGVEEVRGKRNTMLVAYQSKEKFAAELEVHERTQMKLRDNQRMWITALRSDTEERVVTFRSRLEAMKAMSDQDIAKELDVLGAAADQANVEYMARAGMVSDELRLKRMEKHPIRVQNIAAARAAQAEAIQKVRAREQKLIEQFKELYGIDPMASSFFSYQGEDAVEGASVS